MAANEGLPTRSISAITKAKVEAIFHDQYWMPSRADVLPVGIDCAVFDAAVHHGVVAAGRLLQQAINALSPRKIAEDARSARSPSTWRMMSAEKADQHHARSTHRLHENTRWLGPPSRRAGATA